MQPFHVVILLFSICLIHGIYRAIQDVREESKQEALQAYYDAMREVISKTTGLSESFMGLAKSVECANESIKEWSVLFPHYGWPFIDDKARAYISKDCIS